MYADTQYASPPYTDGYACREISSLSNQDIGFVFWNGSYDYFTYRRATHSGVNEITFDNGYYSRVGAAGSPNPNFAVPKKIYGIKL